MISVLSLILTYVTVNTLVVRRSDWDLEMWVGGKYKPTENIFLLLSLEFLFMNN